MLNLAALSFVIAIITASLGFTGITVSVMEAAKVSFLFFLILFAASSVFQMVRRHAMKPLKIKKKGLD